MRVRYSFSSRRTRTIDSHNKHRTAFSQVVREMVEKCDIILEVLDSRFLNETRNAELENLVKEKGKKIIYVLNKTDLVDLKKLKKQIEERGIYPYALVSCSERRGGRELRDRIKIEASSLFGKKRQKPGGYNHLNVGIVGYPNTGKSSIINLLVGKHVAKTASEAGFTKGIQKVKLSENIFILDTPGVIEGKEYSTSDEKKILGNAILGARSFDKIKEPGSVVHSLMREYPGMLENHYHVNTKGDSEKLIEELGRRHHFLLTGNKVDVDRTCRLILKEWQIGKIFKDISG